MKVLIVEDDGMQRMVLADLVKAFPRVEIVEAIDGASAWQGLQDGLSPVLCCCDMNMPGMSGLELLKMFRSCDALAEVPFVFITAAADRDTIKSAISAGATNYILKPIDVRQARSRLSVLFKGICERYSEDPKATQARMGMPPARLLDYFSEFKQEIVSAQPAIREYLTCGDEASARAMLDTMRTGCIALGLRHASRMIENLRALEPDLVLSVVNDIEAMVDEQVLRVQTDFGIREVRKPKTD